MLYRVSAQIKGLARRILFYLDREDVGHKEYSEAARQSSGYNAAVVSKMAGCIGFVKRNKDGSDGKIQFAW